MDKKDLLVLSGIIGGAGIFLTLINLMANGTIENPFIR